MESELFSVEINEEGYNWIKRFGIIATIVFVVTILTSSFNIMMAIATMNILKINTISVGIRNYYSINIAILVFNFIFQIVQLFFYRRFSIIAKKAIRGRNSVLFNRSFKWLVIQAVCFLVQVLMSLSHFLYIYLVIYKK